MRESKMDDQERAAFEKWADLSSRQGMRHKDGTYMYARIQDKWEGYQAGRAAAPVAPALSIALEALDKLARLGNEPLLGNSHGNVIAQDALRKIETGQPATAPVAWRMRTGHGTGWREEAPDAEVAHMWTPLYAAPVAAMADGWKLVPTTPTQEMCMVAQEKLREWPHFPFRVSPVYQAMLDAAPEAPVADLRKRDPISTAQSLIAEWHDAPQDTDDWGNRATEALEQCCAEIAKLYAAPVAAPSRVLSIMLAVARCGLSRKPPQIAFVHQVRRLANALSPADAAKFKELLDWHDSGREKCAAEVVLSDAAAAPVDDDKDKRIAELEASLKSCYCYTPEHIDALFGKDAAPVAEPVYCGCGDAITADDGARCGTCVSMKYTPAATPVADTELLPYLRQYRHNDGSDGFVFGYEKEGADRIVATLRAQIAAAPVAAPDDAKGE